MDEFELVKVYEGVSVDLVFTETRPRFGDLFLICGYENPNFPPAREMDFAQFEELKFSQVDDYFGIRTYSGEGDEVAIWLHPLIGDEAVDHHPGPVDGLRIDYSVLRNPTHRIDHFIKVVEQFSTKLPVKLIYKDSFDLGIADIRRDIEKIVDHWAKEGIVVGSEESLEIDF